MIFKNIEDYQIKSWAFQKKLLTGSPSKKSTHRNPENKEGQKTNWNKTYLYSKIVKLFWNPFQKGFRNCIDIRQSLWICKLMIYSFFYFSTFVIGTVIWIPFKKACYYKNHDLFLNYSDYIFPGRSKPGTAFERSSIRSLLATIAVHSFC